MTPKPTDATRIFLSYRHDDVPDAVERIADRLRERFGEPDVFVDMTSIGAGGKWRDALFQALDQCEVTLVVIGPNWMRPQGDDGGLALDDPEDFVRREIEIVLEREISVIPVLWGDAVLPAPEALPAAVRGLTDYQAFGMRRGKHFESDVRLLYELIEAQIRLAATLGRRAASFVIDVIPTLLLNVMFGGTLLTFWLLLSFYHGLALGTTGRTLGRWLMGTRVESDQVGFRRWVFALARPLLGYPFVLASGIGTLQMVLHPQRVAIHDRLFHTRVLQTRRRPIAPSHLRIDAFSRGFDEWLFKTLIGARLGFLIWWAKSFFGIERILEWLEDGLSRLARGGKSSKVDVGAAGQPAPTGLASAGAGAPSVVAAAAGAGGAAAAGSGALTGAGFLGAGALVAMAAPLIVGAALAVGSLTIYERVAPRSWRVLNPSKTIVPPCSEGVIVRGTNVLVFADTSESMGPYVAARDTLIAAIGARMEVRRVNVYTGDATSSYVPDIVQRIDSFYTRGVDAVYIFSDFADGSEPARIDSLQEFLSHRDLRLYLGTVRGPPDSLLAKLAIETDGGLLTHVADLCP